MVNEHLVWKISALSIRPQGMMSLRAKISTQSEGLNVLPCFVLLVWGFVFGFGFHLWSLPFIGMVSWSLFSLCGDCPTVYAMINWCYCYFNSFWLVLSENRKTRSLKHHSNQIMLSPCQSLLCPRCLNPSCNHNVCSQCQCLSQTL